MSVNNAKEAWKIATTQTPVYEYIIVDLEICQKQAQYSLIVHYRAVGSRVIEYSLLSSFNSIDIINKFPPYQAQALITIFTMEKLIYMQDSSLIDEYIRCVKECQNNLHFQ